MKICFVGDNMTLTSGHSRPFFELAIELSKKGHRVIMLSGTLKANVAQKHYSLCTTYPDIEQVRFLQLSKLTRKNIRRSSLINLLKKCDIIHLCTPSLRLLTYLTANYRDRVFWQVTSDYITLQDVLSTGISTFVNFSLLYPKNIALLFHKFLYKPVGQKCTNILCSNRYMLERLVKLGLKREKVHYIPLGVYPKKSFHIDNIQATGKLVYLYFGWLSPIRGLPNLLNAFFAVKKYNKPNAELIIANPGGHLEEDKMIRLIKQHMFADSIRVVPWQEDITPFIAASTAVVLPFRSNIGYSQPPLTIIESMKLGKAVISTRVGSINEIITDGKTGLLVKPGDEDSLARAMLRVADRTFAEGLGKRAAKEIRKKYNWDTVVNEYIDIYRTCLKTCS